MINNLSPCVPSFTTYMPQKQTGYLEIECLCSLAFTAGREVFGDYDGTLGAKCWGNREWWFFFFYLLMLVVWRVVKSLVSFSAFLHGFVESEGAPGSCGLCIFCVAFPCELFYAMRYLGAFLWALQESSVFLEWYWVPVQNGIKLYTVPTCGSSVFCLCPLSSCFRAVLSPCDEEHLPTDFVSFFKCPKEYLYSFWFLAAGLLCCFFYPQAEKNPGCPYLGH